MELLAEAVTPDTFPLVLQWISSTRRGSIETKRNYVDDVRPVWAGYARELGHDRFFVGCFTAEQITAWRIRAEACGARLATIARYLRSLSSLHVYAAERSEGVRNPVLRDDLPRIDKGNSSSSTPVLEKAEIQALHAAATSELDLTVVALLYTLAGRVSEMCAADVTARIERGRRSYLDVTRKENKERILPLSTFVAELLDTQTAGRAEGPLLLDATRDRLDPSDVDRILTRLGHRARVLTCPDVDQSPAPGERRHAFSRCERCRDVTPQVMRASRITHMLDDGVDLVEVQAFADHENPATTVGYRERRRKHERNATLSDAGAAVLEGIRPAWRPDPNADTPVEGTDLVEVHLPGQNPGQLAAPL
ncbi:tyrosine-type recombinase/integrase [Kitasatospora sp. NPDC048365]|uniref:tyrosine-type recombinase/integrase n=1 Tax=Kitasatospora sp. NPDC048365 TaxID=3364050 RepID=UPI00371626F7